MTTSGKPITPAEAENVLWRLEQACNKAGIGLIYTLDWLEGDKGHSLMSNSRTDEFYKSEWVRVSEREQLKGWL